MKKIALMAWAATVMDPAPCRNTVLKWRKEGRISPMPEWMGRGYFVVPTARLLLDRSPPKREPKQKAQRQKLTDRI